MTIKKRFQQIKEAYEESDLEFRKKYGFKVRETSKGIWGPSDLEAVFNMFRQLRMRNKSFLDIGCGDGRVVLTASLFTKAAGIEIDRELLTKAREIQQRLNATGASFLDGDFFSHGFSTYDVLFTNPDTGFNNGLEDKLLSEMKKDALLLVYNHIFFPRFLKRGKTYWFNQIPITEFTR